MTDEEIMDKMAETHDREHEEFRAKEWFWRAEAYIHDKYGIWEVAWLWFDGGVRRATGATNIEAVVNAYRKAQEMEGEE